ncbi:thermonuclease family protein [Candidatus Aminicenantes bacterium AH-873-B07]|nr:thermonuclease family protein [Candidatus Aminicenantes bacterium AH-873-B07]
MKKLKLILFSILIFIILLSFLIKRSFYYFEKKKSFDTGIVIKVYDGDTIKVKFINGMIDKIRFIGVNCPEVDDEREEIRIFAYVAKRFTFVNLYRKKIKLTYDWKFRDKYGRILAYVWLNNNLFNEIIIKKGLAFAFFKFPFKREYQMRFKEAERLARFNKKGFWSLGEEKIISSEQSFYHINEYLNVKFKCQKIYFGKKYIFLDSSFDYAHSFSALIPINEKEKFGNIEKFENKFLIARGLVEKYKKKTQMIIFSPLQLKILQN